MGTGTALNQRRLARGYVKHMVRRAETRTRVPKGYGINSPLRYGKGAVNAVSVKLLPYLKKKKPPY